METAIRGRNPNIKADAIAPTVPKFLSARLYLAWANNKRQHAYPAGGRQKARKGFGYAPFCYGENKPLNQKPKTKNQKPKTKNPMLNSLTIAALRSAGLAVGEIGYKKRARGLFFAFEVRR
ncbi:hypothetical protein [Paenibacillus ihuae]|uniref:hypothetical protein n=1 Tax=Paenibacillus ihuae TaxID=1232431 RepID=UPI0006D57E23|nr:hypothetical protein [Paenibacillus ihuae]